MNFKTLQHSTECCNKFWPQKGLIWPFLSGFSQILLWNPVIRYPDFVIECEKEHSLSWKEFEPLWWIHEGHTIDNFTSCFLNPCSSKNCRLFSDFFWVLCPAASQLLCILENLRVSDAQDKRNFQAQKLCLDWPLLWSLMSHFGLMTSWKKGQKTQW